jgi:hypothetical protein
MGRLKVLVGAGTAAKATDVCVDADPEDPDDSEGKAATGRSSSSEGKCFGVTVVVVNENGGVDAAVIAVTATTGTLVVLVLPWADEGIEDDADEGADADADAAVGRD